MIPLRSIQFRWLLSSTLASGGAQGMERTATAWLALESGGGAFAIGLAFAARMVPSLALGLAAGTIADRSDRTRQLLVVAIASIPLMAVVSWLAGSGTIQVWHVVAISFAIGLIQVFDTPARQTLIVDTVPREVAPNAVAFNAFGTRLFTGIGALGAGLLIPIGGVSGCYLAVGVIYGISAVLISMMRVPKVDHSATERPSFARAMGDAARLIVNVPALRILTISGVVCEVFAFSHSTAMPIVARDMLSSGPEGLGTLNAAASVGGTVSVALLSILPGRVRREPIMAATFAIYGIAILSLAAMHDLALAVVAMVVIGACAAAFDALQQTLIQLTVPEDQRGRAMGIWVLGLGSAPFGHLEMGMLVSAMGAPSALMINGVLVVAGAAVLVAQSPVYRWRYRMRSDTA